MKGQMCFGLVALLGLLVSVLAADNQIYVAVGDTLRLRPPEASPDRIYNVVWKYNGNLVLEWVEGKVDLEFYGTFKNRSKLNTTNAHLEVKSMTKDDSGFYSAEINNVVQRDRYDVKVIRAVPVPEVTTRPLTCGTGSDKDKCTLACNGLESITESEPITYRWKSDGRMLRDNTPNLIITNDEETQRVTTYSCLMENPVSKKESKAHDNPFNKEESESTTGLIVGIIVLVVLVLVVGIVFAVWKKMGSPKWINVCGQKSSDKNVQETRVMMAGNSNEVHESKESESLDKNAENTKVASVATLESNPETK